MVNLHLRAVLIFILILQVSIPYFAFPKVLLREKQRLRWEEKGEYYSTRRLKSESNTLERQNGQELMGYSDATRDTREKSKEYGKDIKGTLSFSGRLDPIIFSFRTCIVIPKMFGKILIPFMLFPLSCIFVYKHI